ncbi:MAG: L,D-transpeptidase [Verrucomicrobiota bacterium]
MPDLAIKVSISEQKVFIMQSKEISWQADVSTSKFGLGFAEGSLMTPTGKFLIDEKIGEGEPLYTQFKGRKPIDVWNPAKGKSDDDKILTRILWLTGIDEQNANTKERYIYFHGTNQENLIGQPASHGCIRLRNHDMLELFQRTPIGTEVEIG